MDKINCPSWEGCAAPLCPLEPLPGAQWFPNEDICHTVLLRKLPWIRVQRKIKRRYLKGQIDSDFCFTLPTLQAIKAPRKGTHGISPEAMYRKGTGQDNQKPPKSFPMPLK
ncbi:MAG: hypothetical protein WC169_11250 [Dehalococcoidia bacterium]|jgi:hypothetical protein